MEQSTSGLSSLIWSTCDDVLRGLFKPSEYGRIILPFVVLRRLDCVLEPKKDEVYHLYEKYKNILQDPSPVIQKQVGLSFFNYSKFDLARIKSDPNNVSINFNNYLQGYSQNVLDIIENFTINPLVEKLQKNKRLYLLIDKFTEFDFHPNVIDNHKMGSIYEELLRKFSEMSNEESGDHFTPRDVVKLLVTLVFGGDKENLEGEGKIRSICDPCCGTGGLLTIGKDWIHEHINENLKISLYGQELNDVTYSICKSDLLMLGEDPENIHGPCSSISDDRLQGKKFDYLITNPPFGVSWKSEQEFVKEESTIPGSRFSVGLPKVSDGALLFLQHLIDKMDPSGSRMGVILNGSPLSSGDANSGESNIRKWILENDWLETIICLPDHLFFNTDITTYIWIVSNKKPNNRKGKVQLINGQYFFDFLRQPLGDKKKELKEHHISELVSEYESFEESKITRILTIEDFRYRKITIEEPLVIDGEVIRDRRGNVKPDPKKKDIEYVPSKIDLQTYFQEQFLKYKPQCWINHDKEKIGYEIGFNSYFHKNIDIDPTNKIYNELKKLDIELEKSKSALFNSEHEVWRIIFEGLGYSKNQKKSGIDWIGKLPVGWSVEPLYIHFNENKIKNEEDSQEVLTLSYGKVKKRDLSKNFGLLPESFKTYQVVDPEMIIIRPTDLQNDKKSLRVGHVKQSGVITNAYIGLVPIEDIDTRYFYYYLHLCDLKKVFYGLGSGLRQSLSFQNFKRFPLLIPPVSERIEISNLLDEFDGRVNQLVLLEQKKINLLEQIKRSSISDIVSNAYG